MTLDARFLDGKPFTWLETIRAAAVSPTARPQRGSADSPSPLESAETYSLHTALAPLTRDRVNLAAGRFVHRTDDELTGGIFNLCDSWKP